MFRDELNLSHRSWAAKRTNDESSAEIFKKTRRCYKLNSSIFEATGRAPGQKWRGIVQG